MFRKISLFFYLIPTILFAHLADFSLVEGEACVGSSLENGVVLQVGSGAHITWDRFQVDEGEKLVILQPPESRGVHLSVKGEELSTILGEIISNGPLSLTHPGKLIVGKTGKVIASGHEISIQSREVAIFSEGALDVSASQEGNGGTIKVMGEDILFFFGAAYACGGALSGNGGNVILCSKGSLHYDFATIDTTATHGLTGCLRIDPKDIYIIPGGMDDPLNNTFGSHSDAKAMISGAALSAALNTSNVVMQANTDIIIDDHIIATTALNGLTLQAGRSIIIDPQVTVELNQGAFSAKINDSQALLGERDSGPAQFQMNLGSQVKTQGGAITCETGNFGGEVEGAFICNGSTLDAGGGNISITGYAPRNGEDDAQGIIINGKSLIQTSGSGTIDLTGTGGNGDKYCFGIDIFGSQARVITESGSISFTGQGGGNINGGSNTGIFFEGAASTESGSITIVGIAGLGGSYNTGVEIGSAFFPNLSTIDGDIQVIGIGDGTGDQNYGVNFGNSSLISSAGLGSILVNGTAGVG